MKYPTPVLILFLIGFNQARIENDPNGQIAKFVENFKTTLDGTINKLTLPEDVFLNISSYLNKYYYPFETHQVTTDDGFILELHRIPSKSSSVVLMEPPLLASSIDYVNQGPNTALALLLHDEGYDVWIINPRGTKCSMNHRTLNSSEKAFWDFSFHEKGIYDIPASIDFVLNATDVSKLTLVGFSEGTSASMAMLSTRTEYNDKLKLLVLLSPIGYMGGVKSSIPLLLMKYMTELEILTNIYDIYGLPYTSAVSELFIKICTIDGFSDKCSDVLGSLMGYDPDQLDKDYMLVLMADKPAGISLKQLIHYGQEIRTASFRQFDYGAIGNMKRYGRLEPPAYDPAKITVPVSAYYGKNDFFAAVSDVEKLLGQLPNLVNAYLVEYEYFSHLDFIGAKDVRTMLYDKVLSDMKKYSN